MNGPSFTAETMALQRSFETHGGRRRRFADPYADGFLRPSFRALAAVAAVPGLRRLAIGAYDLAAGPGPRPSAIIRTKLIDDAVTAVAPAVTQCVILGAGYDTRAHRLPALAGVRVFEVDQPGTQAVKRMKIARLGVATGEVDYVPVDFERDDLAAALTGTGFDPGARTVFLWEGVSQYLTPAAVDGTLGVVRSLGTSPSRLIMTYVDARALREPSPFPEARRWVEAVARAGEPWIFGLVPDAASAFFADRGFRLLRDVSTFDAGREAGRAAGTARSVPRQRQRGDGSALYRVCVCEFDAA